LTGAPQLGYHHLHTFPYTMLPHQPSQHDPSIPRRVMMTEWCEGELAITEAIDAVESMPPHPLLTDAVVLLAEARSKVADFVELPVPVAPEPKTPRLFCHDEETDCYLPVPEDLAELLGHHGVANVNEMDPDGGERVVRFKRLDLTEAEYRGLPEM
jgi:hypothetical protein